MNRLLPPPSLRSLAAVAASMSSRSSFRGGDRTQWRMEFSGRSYSGVDGVSHFRSVSDADLGFQPPEGRSYCPQYQPQPPFYGSQWVRDLNLGFWPHFRPLLPQHQLNSSPNALEYRGGGRTQWCMGFSNRSYSGIDGESHFRSVSDANLGFRPSEGRPYCPPYQPQPPFYGSQSVRDPNLQFRPHFGPLPPQQQLNSPPHAPHQQQFCSQPQRPSDYRRWEYSRSGPSPYRDVQFKVLSYNLLAEYLAINHRGKLYFHIPRYILDWNWRKRSILSELGLWSADILCFQEVDRFQDLEEELKFQGYSGIWKRRTGDPLDGCAIFWRVSRFKLLHEEFIEYNKLGLRNNVAQICVLELMNQNSDKDMADSPMRLPSRNKVVVCNIHVLYNPRRGEIKLGQVRVLLDKAHAVSKHWDNAPVVLCGDFNCTPKSPLYNYLSEQKLDLSDLPRDKVSGQASAEIHPETQFNPNFRPQSGGDYRDGAGKMSDGEKIRQLGSSNLHGDRSPGVNSANVPSVTCSPQYNPVLEMCDSSLMQEDCSNKIVVSSNGTVTSKTYQEVYSGEREAQPTLSVTVIRLEEPLSLQNGEDLFVNNLKDGIEHLAIDSCPEDNCSSLTQKSNYNAVDSYKDEYSLITTGGPENSPVFPIFSNSNIFKTSSEESMSGVNVRLDEKMENLSIDGLEEPNIGDEVLVEDSSKFLSELHDDNSSFSPGVDIEPVNKFEYSYDPSAWTPMEIESATGSADCTCMEHFLKLKSTYTEVENLTGTRDSNGEPLVTSYNRRFLGTVDYIWRSEGLQTIRVLAPIPKQAMQWTSGFPTKKWGSDHIALVSELAFVMDSITQKTEAS